MKTMTWNLPSCVTCCVIFLLLLCFCDAYRSSDRYKYMSYGEINRGMLSLAKRYPHLLHVYSANRHFHLPPAGLCRAENSVRQSSPCEVFVAEVGTRPTETTRPQVHFPIHVPLPFRFPFWSKAMDLLAFSSLCTSF